MQFRRLLMVAVLAAMGCAAYVAPAGASSEPSLLDREPTAEEWDAGQVACSLTVIGREKDGRLITEPMECWLTEPGKADQVVLQSDGLNEGAGSGLFTASWGVIATHYDGYWGGSYIQIWGDVCNGGWLDLSWNWVNRISTTVSSCSAGHYDGYGLTGQVEWQSVGTLGFMDNRTNSIIYY